MYRLEIFVTLTTEHAPQERTAIDAAKAIRIPTTDAESSAHLRIGSSRQNADGGMKHGKPYGFNWL